MTNEIPSVAVAELARAAISRMQTKKTVTVEAFQARFSDCTVHGEYPLNMIDEHGTVRWFQSDCPTCRKQEDAKRLLASSNIPKRFEGCDFENYQATTPEQQSALARCVKYAEGFKVNRDNGACLLLCGKPGTGKNHLATAICKRVLNDGFSVLRVKASQYLDAYWSKSFEDREGWLKGMAGVDLLMIDEIGRSSNAKSAQDAFFRLLDGRYEAQLPSLLATNLNRDELMDVLGDATYDRLTQGGSIRLTFDWASYRGKI